MSLVGKNAGKVEPVLYLPFINFQCLSDNLPGFELKDFTESEFKHYYTYVQYMFTVNHSFIHSCTCSYTVHCLLIGIVTFKT